MLFCFFCRDLEGVQTGRQMFQFRFHVITHKIKMSQSLFESLCKALAPEQAIAKVKSSNQAPTSGLVMSIAGYDPGTSIALPHQRAKFLLAATDISTRRTSHR